MAAGPTLKMTIMLKTAAETEQVESNNDTTDSDTGGDDRTDSGGSTAGSHSGGSDTSGEASGDKGNSDSADKADKEDGADGSDTSDNTSDKPGGGDDVDTSDDTDTSDDAGSSEDTGSPEDTGSSDGTGSSDKTGSLDETGSSENTDSSEDTDLPDETGSSEDTGSSDDTGSSENTGSSDDTDFPDETDSSDESSSLDETKDSNTSEGDAVPPSDEQKESTPEASGDGNTESEAPELPGEIGQKPDEESEPETLDESMAVTEAEEILVTYTIDPEDSATVKGKETVTLGSSLKFTVKADEGFEIAAVYANGEKLTSVEAGEGKIASGSDADMADHRNTGRQTYKIADLQEDTEIEIQMSELEQISILTAEFDGMLITIEAPRGVLPEDAALQVTAVDEEPVMQMLKAQPGQASIQKIKALDIKILDADGNETEPKSGVVKVSITNLPFEADADSKSVLSASLEVYHVNEAGSKAESMGAISDSHTVEFETTHFSVFAIVLEDEGVAETIEIKDGENYLFDASFNGRTVVLHGDATAATITVDKDVNMNLILGSDGQELNIDAEGAAGTYLNTSDAIVSKAAINLLVGTDVTVTLVGEATLKGDAGYAGIYVDEKAELTINGSGTLNASGNKGGAGIGGNLWKNGSIAGSIIIACDDEGRIIADSTDGAAAIGGGAGLTNDPTDINVGDSVSIEIRNGHIEANSNEGGSTNGAAIGSGNAGDARSIIISGGTITAVSTGAGAAIGSGNHSNNSGDEREGRGNAKIVITGGVIKAIGSGGGAAIGTGLGSSNASETNGGGRTKAPGYYYADIDITGGEIHAYAGEQSNDQNLAAAIGGGQYGDAKIYIGGYAVIHEASVASNALEKWYYQGAPGIGGGYQGYAEIEIDGNAVIESASGGCGAPGIGSGAVVIPSYGDKHEKRATIPYVEHPSILIDGGTIKESVGGYYAAGIGSGFGTEECNITISGGTIELARGGNGPEGIETDHFYGGAGIGSGVGAQITSNAKYSATTKTNINITGGTIERAVGGWGAAGIGSGARNDIAEEINIDAAADIAAFADGTKFAIDTFTRTELGVPETSGTINFTPRIGSNILQGTFMDRQAEGIDYMGLTAAIWEDGNPQSGEELLYTGSEVRTESIPEGYRSFAVTVDSEKDYLVAAHKNGTEPVWFRYDALGKAENQPTSLEDVSTYHHATGENHVSDNQWLYVGETQPDTQPVVPENPDPPEPENPDLPGPETPEPPEPELPAPPEPELPAPPEPETPTPPGPETPIPPETDNPEPPVPGTPGGGGGGGGGSSDRDRGTTTPTEPAVTILPEEVPLAALPSEVSSDQLFEITDAEVPLAGLPKTGSRSFPAADLGVFSMLLIAAYAILNKKKETE